MAKDVSREILIDFLTLVLLLASVLAIDAGLKHAEAYFALPADLMYWLHKVAMWTAIMSIALFLPDVVRHLGSVAASEAPDGL